MMSRIAPLALVLTLAACGDDTAEEDVSAVAVTEPVAAPVMMPEGTADAADGAAGTASADEAQDPTAEAATAQTSTAPAKAAPAGNAQAPAAEAATPAARPSAAPSPRPAAASAPAAKPSLTPVAATTAPPAAFNQCKACHSVQPGAKGIGPSLANVFGAKAGHMAGYNYSKAMEEADITWNEQTLHAYLADPRGVVPGTKMIFPGMKDAEKRQAVIDYLKTL